MHRQLSFLFFFFSLLSSLLGAPGLSFDALKKVCDVPAQAKQVSVQFFFENKTKKPQTILRYDSACSCLSAKVKGGKLNYLPGEKGALEITFDLGNFSGAVEKSVALWLDGDSQEKPSILLLVEVHIPELVTFSPRTIVWKQGEHAKEKTLLVTMKKPPLHIEGLRLTNDNFAARLEVLKKGERYALHLVAKDTQKPSYGLLIFATDSPIKRFATQRVFLTVSSKK